MAAPIRRYYLHRMTAQSGLFWPIFPLFLLSRGVTFAGIGTLLAVQAGTTLLAEVPTGYVGDRVGRRNSLVLGSALVAIALVGFVLAGGFPGFVAVYVCYGIGSALRSGSGDAWLYDVLAARGDGDRFTTVRGRGESATHWASAACMVLSGALYLAHPTVPFLAAAGLTAVNVTVLLTLPAVGGGSGPTTGIPLGRVLPLARETIAAPAIRPVVVFAAAFFAVERSITEFIPSVTTAVVDASTLLEGLVADPTAIEVMSVGLLFAFLTATSAVAGAFAGRVRASIGPVRGLVLAGGVSALVLAGAFVSVTVAVVGFVLVKTADALVRPLVTGYVNDRVETAGRATVLSILSMAFTLTQLPVLVAIGAIADHASATTATAILGAGFLAVAAATLLVTNVVAVRATVADRAGG